MGLRRTGSGDRRETHTAILRLQEDVRQLKVPGSQHVDRERDRDQESDRAAIQQIQEELRELKAAVAANKANPDTAAVAFAAESAATPQTPVRGEVRTHPPSAFDAARVSCASAGWELGALAPTAPPMVAVATQAVLPPELVP